MKIKSLLETIERLDSDIFELSKNRTVDIKQMLILSKMAKRITQSIINESSAYKPDLAIGLAARERVIAAREEDLVAREMELVKLKRDIDTSSSTNTQPKITNHYNRNPIRNLTYQSGGVDGIGYDDEEQYIGENEYEDFSSEMNDSGDDY